MLHKLVDGGKSVIVIEHNLAVMAQSDWLIDVGPGAGHDGGKASSTGTPEEMVAGGDSPTAQYLRDWVSA
ncbi:MAG: hypothetical protein M9934_03445 [Thermomicrobiales bacterium]|nr:hypothetical protein [Thermomicrobiales bacterium]